MTTSKKIKPLADRCPKCGHMSLHKTQRYCMAYRCYYGEVEIKRRAPSKS